MKKKEAKTTGLLYERKNFFKGASEADRAAAFQYAEAYKDFLNQAKTVRETVAYVESQLKKHKFTPLGAKNAKNRVYSIFRGKTMAFAVLGTEPLSSGINMVAAHIDAPRVDLKQNPLYEDNSSATACMRTH
jgi:aspartyl aminopeptidase